MPKMESAGMMKFAKEYMNWLQSNERKHFFKIENKDYLYIRLSHYDTGIDYIFKKDMTSKNVCCDARYSTKEKICLFIEDSNKEDHNLEKFGFYDEDKVISKFDKIFKEVLPMVYLTNYKDKVGVDESLAEEFIRQMKSHAYYNSPIEYLRDLRKNDELQTDYPEEILFEFIAKGETKEAMKEWLECIIKECEDEECEDESNFIFSHMHRAFLTHLEKAKNNETFSKAYVPTEHKEKSDLI